MGPNRGGIRTAKRIKIGIAVLAGFLFACTASMAGDFPGKGEYADWSAALPYYNQANRYLNQGRYQDAILKYQTAIMQYQYDPDFYVNLGVAFRKSDQYEAAEDALKRATELSPKDWIPWSDLANAYLKQNKLKETISAFQRALKCNPPSVEANAMRKDIQDIEKILRMQGKSGPQTTAAEPDYTKAKKKGESNNKSTSRSFLSTKSKITTQKNHTAALTPLAAQSGMTSNNSPGSGNNNNNHTNSNNNAGANSAANAPAGAKRTKQLGSQEQAKQEKEMLQKSGWDYISK